MLRDFGRESEGVVYADSSAALAIARRKGAGKMRHINVNSLWIQERQNEKDLELRKVLGTENPADLMTKNLARQALDKCMLQLNQHRTAGRAQTSLNIQGKGTTNVTTGSISSEEPVVTGRLSENEKPTGADSSTESDATDPEMPALIPLALPAKRSARATLARLDNKPKDKSQVASSAGGRETPGAVGEAAALLPALLPALLHSDEPAAELRRSPTARLPTWSWFWLATTSRQVAVWSVSIGTPWSRPRKEL